MMDFVTRVLFESLPWLLVFCLLGLTIALVVHRRRQTRASRRGIWITLAVCVGLILLQRMVVTDREAIWAALEGLALAVDEGDIDGIGQYVDDDFRVGNRRRKEFLDTANRTLQYYQVDGVRITSTDVQVAGDGAVVSFWVRCEVRGGNSPNEFLLSRWRIHFVRRGDRWLMDRLEEGRADLPVGNSGGVDLLTFFRWGQAE